MNYQCKCGHQWTARNPNKIPLSCPKCKQYGKAKKITTTNKTI